ncbi:MAG: pyridoxamine 5'-phosphate oxidase family protein [Lysobacterales bacterium]
MTEGTKAKLDDLIAKFNTAMLVTQSLADEPRARPMAIAGHGDGSVLYFATRSDDEKLQELLKHPRVAVTMQADGYYLSITGEARLQTDVLLAEELWSPDMRLWFPDGYRDTELTIIRVDPTYAEFWDRTGLRKLEFLWEAGKAVVRGEKANDQSLQGHEKVRFDKPA